MRKGNRIEERFETVKRLVHDDPAAMDIVEGFRKEFRATEKLKKLLYAISGASIIAASIAIVLAILSIIFKIGNICVLFVILAWVLGGIAYFLAKFKTAKFSHYEIEYVNACLEEQCPGTSVKYPVSVRAGKFFADVDGEILLLDSPYPDAPLEGNSYVYYEYPLYQLDEYDGITCQKKGTLVQKECIRNGQKEDMPEKDIGNYS